MHTTFRTTFNNEFKKQKQEMQDEFKKQKQEMQDAFEKHKQEVQEMMGKIPCAKKDVTLLPSVIQTSTITIPGVTDVHLISCESSDRLWVSNESGMLLQVDSEGNVLRSLDKVFIDIHTITENGDLLFIVFDDVKKVTSNGIITTLFKTNEIILCIHSSSINGDILLGSRLLGLGTGKVTRYNWTGRKILDIEEDKQGVKLYDSPHYITENKNGDIWISDKDKVVVVDKTGKHRFNYRGHNSFMINPKGICTDILGQVLVCDDSESNPSVHLLDQDGWFLSMLLTRQDNVRSPQTVCVDDKNNLYLGQNYSNKISVYKYLQVSEK